MRSAVFWNYMQRKWVDFFDVWGQPIGPIFKVTE